MGLVDRKTSAQASADDAIRPMPQTKVIIVITRQKRGASRFASNAATSSADLRARLARAI
jgi:hypothetical protein